MCKVKSKLTASVRPALVELFDQKVSELKVDRSDAVEQAIEMWLNRRTEEEEEVYFATYASELRNS